jgi:hypothetical protein
MGGKAMTERMARCLFGNTGLDYALAENFLHMRFVEMVSPTAIATGIKGGSSSWKNILPTPIAGRIGKCAS